MPEAQERTELASSTVLLARRIRSRALKAAMQRGRVARSVCVLVDAPSAGSNAGATSGSLTALPTTTLTVSREGKRLGRRGGAEGTRTPDPHTASVVEEGSW